MNDEEYDHIDTNLTEVRNYIDRLVRERAAARADLAKIGRALDMSQPLKADDMAAAARAGWDTVAHQHDEVVRLTQERDAALAEVERLRAELADERAEVEGAMWRQQRADQARDDAYAELRCVEAAALPVLPDAKLDAAVWHALEYLEDGGVPESFGEDDPVTDQAAALLTELVRIAAVRAERLDRVALPALPDTFRVTFGTHEDNS